MVVGLSPGRQFAEGYEWKPLLDTELDKKTPFPRYTIDGYQFTSVVSGIALPRAIQYPILEFETFPFLMY
jgi:hypothetical protein